jgi:hypothetical protein
MCSGDARLSLARPPALEIQNALGQRRQHGCRFVVTPGTGRAVQRSPDA